MKSLTRPPPNNCTSQKHNDLLYPLKFLKFFLLSKKSLSIPDDNRDSFDLAN